MDISCVYWYTEIIDHRVPCATWREGDNTTMNMTKTNWAVRMICRVKLPECVNMRQCLVILVHILVLTE